MIAIQNKPLTCGIIHLVVTSHRGLTVADHAGSGRFGVDPPWSNT